VNELRGGVSKDCAANMMVFKQEERERERLRRWWQNQLTHHSVASRASNATLLEYSISPRGLTEFHLWSERQFVCDWTSLLALNSVVTEAVFVVLTVATGKAMCTYPSQ
jgi:hypothetical protein